MQESVVTMAELKENCPNRLITTRSKLF